MSTQEGYKEDAEKYRLQVERYKEFINGR